MKILAIDQSFTSSGIVLLEGDKILHCEKFTSDAETDMFDRAYEVACQLVDVAKRLKPDVVVIEGLAFSAKGNQTRNLAGLQYVIVNYFRDAGFDVQIAAPNTAKKTAGFGHKEKGDMIAALPKHVHKKFLELGVKKTTGMGDLADAYWIGKSI